MARYQSNNLLGIGLMLLAMILFQLMDAVAKLLVTDDISAAQIIAVRGWIIVAFIPAMLALQGKTAALKTRQPFRHLARGMIGFFAPFTFFTSLRSLPLADATVIFFSSAFILTAASALWLREQVGIHRWSAVVVGFVGVIIAIDPGGGGDVQAYLLVLCATAIYSFVFISGKVLSKQDSITSVVFSLHLGMAVSATLFLPWVWVPFTAETFSAIVVFAAIALAAHYVFAAAFAYADVSVLAPFEYTSLVWATIIGYVIWSDFPAARVWVGAVIIIACGLYVIHREALHHKSRAGLRD